MPGANVTGLRDRTRGRAAAADELSVAKLEALLSLTADAVISIDERGNVETLNASAQRIFGYSPEEIVGRNVNVLMPAPHASRHDAYIGNYLRTGRTRIIGIGRETLARRRDGTTFPIALAVTESVVNGRRLFTGVIRDLTEIKAAQRELQEHRALLEVLVAERTAALLEANRRLELLALTDPLTQIANRRKFDETLASEAARARRGGLGLALLLCDVDHFKQYNDCYGHAAGDACLRAVAKALAQTFRRAGELCARYGGEEFAVVLPDVGAKSARARAHLARRAVWNLNIAHKSSTTADRVTISIGAAVCDGCRGGAERLLQRADAALYLAKKRGRNRLAIAGD